MVDDFDDKGRQFTSASILAPSLSTDFNVFVSHFTPDCVVCYRYITGLINGSNAVTRVNHSRPYTIEHRKYLPTAADLAMRTWF